MIKILVFCLTQILQKTKNNRKIIKQFFQKIPKIFSNFKEKILNSWNKNIQEKFSMKNKKSYKKNKILHNNFKKNNKANKICISSIKKIFKTIKLLIIIN